MKRRIPTPSAEERALIESLLQKRMETIAPRSAFRHELYGKLIRSHIDQSRTKWNLFGWLLASKRMISAAVACIALASGGVLTTYAYTSPDVTRENNLYILKEAVENLRITLSATPEDKASVQLDLADRRKAELESMSSEGRIDEETLTRMLDSIRKATALSDQVTEDAKRAELKDLINKSSRDKREALLQLIVLLEGQSSQGVGSQSSTATSNVTILTESGGENSSPMRTASFVNHPDVLSLQRTANALAQIESVTSTLPPSTTPTSSVDSSSSISSTPTMLRKIGLSSSATASVFSIDTSDVSGPINGQEPLNSNAIRQLPDIRLTIQGRNTFDTSTNATLTLILDNIGGSPAGPFTISYDWGDGSLQTTTIDGLAMGDSKRVDISHQYTRTGQYFLNVVANNHRSVRESTESNNSKRAFIQINQGDGTAPSYDAPTCAINCTVGDSRCVGNSVSTCVRTASGCPVWSNPLACSSTQVCLRGNCQN